MKLRDGRVDTGERQLVVGGEEDMVAEGREARPKQIDVGGDVVEEVRDILLMDVADAALLDVNLAGELSYPVASRLDTLAVPFVFATGYGAPGLPERWGGHLVIQKPFQLEALASAMRMLLEHG